MGHYQSLADQEHRVGAVGAAMGAMLVGIAALVPSVAVLAQTSTTPATQRASVAPRAMQSVAPALADYTDYVLFGEVWRRPELSPRDRSLVTLSVLIATGKAAQLTGHVGRALGNDVEPAEIAGIVTHLAFYAGWPNAVSSLEVIDKVFAERKVDMAALRRRPHRLPPLPSDDTQARAVTAEVGSVAPKLAELTNGLIFDGLWRRDDLSPRDRSLVTIAALAANGELDDLAFYVERGLQNGLTREQIGEALTHLAFYAGWPKATAGVAIAAKVFAGGRQAANVTKPLQVFPAGAAPTATSLANFSGAVTLTSPFKATGTDAGGATVSFKPGAHTNWHSHPKGQLLIITEGSGLVQAASEPVRLVRAGDVVWTAPSVRHWHGATPTRAMTHVAVSESPDGQTATWFEPVANSDYQGRRIAEAKD